VAGFPPGILGEALNPAGGHKLEGEGTVYWGLSLSFALAEPASGAG